MIETGSAVLDVAIATLVGFILGAVLRGIFDARRERLEQLKPWRISPGDRVRFMAAIPEHHIEAGEGGRIYMIYPGDELEYWVAPDRDSSVRLKFLEHELWQLEIDRPRRR